MTIRLNKVTRDLNVGITTAVEFLQKKGFTVEANPNTKITDEQFEMLKKEFSNDKNLKIKSERFIQERQSSKDRNKGGTRAVASEKEKQEETKAVVPGDKMQKFKVLGKIDLSKPLQSGGYVPVSEPAAQTEAAEAENKETVASVNETPEMDSQPMAEDTVQPESVSEQPEAVEEALPQSEEQPVAAIEEPI